ncbi:hypothetical protein HGRIS_001893 [Hohenbuehelia grisea]|uniref:Beta-mannosidase A n=1 Tax=Hohenbuehelia grisea TaxID=104357 RepID=A0ABR3JIW7_9AGAR
MRRSCLKIWAISCWMLSLLVVGDTFDLSSLQWTLKNSNGSITIPGSVPSQSHLDLLKAGIITEPLLGINDFTERWVIDENWTYTADLSPFTRTVADGNTSDQTLLVFYGIDTIANITFAGHPIAWVNNQFQQYVFDVSGLLDSPLNNDTNVTVAFESAWTYGLNVTARPDAEDFLTGIVRMTDNFEYPNVRQWVRKVASDFGWDWGPAFIPSGIYKPAYLVNLSNVTNGTFSIGTPPVSASLGNDTGSNSSGPLFIEESSVDTYKLGQTFSTRPNQTAQWVVNVTLALRAAAQIAEGGAQMTLAFPELNITSAQFPLPAFGGRGSGAAGPSWVNATWLIPDEIPQRWFPHNLGTGPKLFNLSVNIGVPTNTPDNTTASVSFTTRTGFRTIELIQTRYPDEEVRDRGITPGDNWHFEINGQPFYALGTNIIPFDPFYARTTSEQVRWVLESAVASGQNMLRVWGGGTYQPSSPNVAGGVYDFYEACDELGILAWSELIFSDSLYPINDFLLESIEPEVRQNVRRVNRHPSNAQWAGGNEIEGIVVDVNRSTAISNGTHYLNEYVALFQDFLQGVVTSETRSVPYTDCSTTKGVLSLDPYVLRFNNGTPGEIYGNGERYNYDANQAFNYSTFPVTRFMNEFGQVSKQFVPHAIV